MLVLKWVVVGIASLLMLCGVGYIFECLSSESWDSGESE